MGSVRFLIVRFSSIGDIVLTTPVIRCLKKQVVGAEIHYLTKKQFEPILINNPYIDKLHLLDDSLNQVIGEIKKVKPDYIIDLHNSIRSFILKSRFRLVSFNFNKLNFEKWLYVNFRINKLPDLHIVDRYLQTTKIFDVQNDHEGLNYFIPPRDHVDLPSHFPGILKNEYVALVIGAQHETKKMPVDKLAEFCRNLNLPVVLLGGPGDKKAGDEIFIKSGKNVKNGCGKFNINQSASIVQQANIVVSHDTGLMHVAAAFKKKIVSLWGNTVPAFGMYPYQPHPSSERFEIQNLPCRPCSKIGFQKCPRGHFKCMNEIDVLEVADRVRRLYQLDQIKAS